MAETATASTPSAYGSSTEAEANWRRYQYAKDRGHLWYIEQARRCEGFYLGAGGQWSQADRMRLWETGRRPAYEWNEIMPAVNAAVGYQIHNRMDIAFMPRGGRADSELATLRSKVAMQICDHNKFHWLETQCFSDGLIEQRGYYDIRMAFEHNVYGDAHIETLDPRDVAPDPDAKSYDPKDWYDVIVTRWYSLDTIEERYGKEARNRVQTMLDAEGDHGADDETGERNKFGSDQNSSTMWDAFTDDPSARHYRIIDRQCWKYTLTKVVIYPNGDVHPVEDANEEQLAEYMAQGAVMSKRMTRVVQWTVTTRWVTLHSETSPYDRFTIIPYFCYFRRGQTRGMVDNGISPQEVLNKAISQFVHILNTTANSGWTVEENSLVGMRPEQLEDEGSKTGLVVVFKAGTQRPEKILPNPIPPGIDRLIDHASKAVRNATLDPSLRGLDEKEESGLARQTQQFAAQQGLAIPLDNLARTRHLVAEHLSYLMTTFYDNHRMFRITETDPNTGRKTDKPYEVNKFDPITKTWQNDLTEGEYDVVVTEQPMQVTFENSQFEQTIEMRKLGVHIPDNIIIKHSNLADKIEILDQMEAQTAPQPSPLEQAKTMLMEAQAALAKATADGKQADTTETRVTSQFSAVQAAQAIAATPQIAPLADQLLKSAGFQDQDAPPIVPGLPGLPPGAPPSALPGGPLPPAMPAGVPGAEDGVPITPNTSPAFPAKLPKPMSPAAGGNAGIEGGGEP